MPRRSTGSSSAGVRSGTCARWSASSGSIPSACGPYDGPLLRSGPVSGTVAVHGAAARRRLFRLGEYRDLFGSLLRRELRVKYKGSAFGVLWTYLYPLFMMGVYTLV